MPKPSPTQSSETIGNLPPNSTAAVTYRHLVLFFFPEPVSPGSFFTESEA
jgi:hypothetical protein